MGFLKKITDLIYRVKQAKKKYALKYPNETILAIDASKAIKTNKKQDIRRGSHWVLSERGVVVLTNQRIKFGNWDIPLEDVKNAEMLEISSSGQLLKLETNHNEYYQFGMQKNNEWRKQEVLPITFGKETVKYSFFSIAVRVIFLVAALYLIIRQFWN